MSKRATSPNTLPVVTRADGIIDVAENRWNVSSVEAEYDRAMKAQGDFERAHPVESAVSSLVHCWKHNRHSSSGCDYGWMLDLYMKRPEWATVKLLVEAKGLPVTVEAWHVEEINHLWATREKLINEGRMIRYFMKQEWWSSYEAFKRVDHPVLRGKWNGDLI